jgi:hypothetical protein
MKLGSLWRLLNLRLLCVGTSACAILLGSAQLGQAAPTASTFGYDDAPGVQGCGGVGSLPGNKAWSDPIYAAWDFVQGSSQAHLVLKLNGQIQRYPALRSQAGGLITYSANPAGVQPTLSFPNTGDGHQTVGGAGSLQLFSPGDSAPVSLPILAVEGC